MAHQVMVVALAEHYRDAEVVAVDGTAALLERTRSRAEAAGARVTTVRAELPDGLAGLPKADLIWTSQTVHHLGDQRAAIAALARRLNPAGVLVVAEGGLPTWFPPQDPHSAARRPDVFVLAARTVFIGTAP